MRQPPWVQACVRAGQRYSFARSSRARHNAVNLALLLALVATIVATVASTAWVDASYRPPRSGADWLTLIAFLMLAVSLAGWCYFGILILVVHEASHGMFLLHGHAQRRRKLNHVSGLLACVPFAVDFAKHWEQGHLVPHRRPL